MYIVNKYWFCSAQYQMFAKLRQVCRLIKLIVLVAYYGISLGMLDVTEKNYIMRDSIRDFDLNNCVVRSQMIILVYLHSIAPCNLCTSRRKAQSITMDKQWLKTWYIAAHLGAL